MSDIMTDMRQVSVRSLQRETASILEIVSRGEEIVVTKRNKIIARILPPENYSKPPLSSDFKNRFSKALIQTKTGTQSPAEILRYSRGE